MNELKHKKRHEELHRALDELVADWISHHGIGKPYRGLTNTSIMELIKWSHEQTINPTTPLG